MILRPLLSLPSDQNLVRIGRRACVLGLLGLFTMGATLPGAVLLLGYVLWQAFRIRWQGWSLSRAARAGLRWAVLALVLTLLTGTTSTYLVVASFQSVGVSGHLRVIADLRSVADAVEQYYAGADKDDPPLTFSYSHSRRVVIVGGDPGALRTIPLGENVIVSGFRFVGSKDWCVSMTKTDVRHPRYRTFGYSREGGLFDGECRRPGQAQ